MHLERILPPEMWSHARAVQKLDRRCFAAFYCSIRRDNIAGVSQNEKLTRIGLSEQVGIDAGI